MTPELQEGPGTEPDPRTVLWIPVRSRVIPVVWVQHESEELPRDSSVWQLVPELVPAIGEQRVYKRFPSSFEATNLEDGLGRLGTTRIVLAGAQTNWCIRATAYAALDRGYDLLLLKDAHTTSSIDLGNGTRVEASSMVTDLNIAMKWLSYPGRRNTTAKAMKVEAKPRATLLDLPTQNVDIPPGEAREVAWEVTAPTQLAFTRAEAILWEIEARDTTSGARDALKARQRIVPAAPVTVQQATLVQLDGPYSLEVAAPDGGAVQTQLALPEGHWQRVASLQNGVADPAPAGTLASGDAVPRESRELQIRVRRVLR